MEYTTSPSPIPPLVKAEHVSSNEPNYIKKCSIENDMINITVLNVNTNIFYNQKISLDDLYGTWNEISKYFQNDFNKFYLILDNCFKDVNQDVKLNISQNDSNSLTLNFKYEGLFGFTFDIVVTKELDLIDKLALEISELKKENRILNEKYSKIMDILRNHTNWIDEEFIWLELDNVCIRHDPNHNITISHENYSGEIFSSGELDKMKDRMLKNKYNACQKNGAGRHYYFRNSWRESLLSLMSLPEKCPEYTKVYIKLPKQDVINIGLGLGDTSIENDKKTRFHGKLRRQGYDDTTVHKMIVCHGDYIKEWESLKNLNKDCSRTDRYCSHPNQNSHKSITCFKSLFDLQINNTAFRNIKMPINYYCTNCEKVDEYFPNGKGKNKPGWEIFRCLGH